MGFFKNIFSKEKISSDAVSDKKTMEADSCDCFGQAEQIANVVSSGLENQDYSEMNKQLLEIVPQSEKKESYVFDCPNTWANALGIIICAVLIGLFLYIAFIGATSALFSLEYRLYGLLGFGCSLAFIAVNAVLIAQSVSAIRYRQRFGEYAKILKFKSVEILADLAQLSSRNEPQVIKDLEVGVKQKLIPQGHFTRGNLAFIVSDGGYEKYQNNCASYDRYFKKQIEEKTRMRERTEEISRIIETGNSYIEKIRDYNAIIKDKYVSEKLDRIETVVSMIFNEVDSNPEQAHSLGLFLNYYLPTMEKLLEAYVSINEKPVAGQSLAKAKKDIEQSLETIIKAYESILERLYSEHEADIASDIAAMEIMMKQEGLTE